MRGATIAGMIVVNNPGTWSAVYEPLRHAEWHGWTYTDTIFPFFLFLVGVSIALSFGVRRAAGATRRDLARKTAVRAAILVALGLALNLAGYLAFHKEHYRVPGVLQRIGLCVLAAGLVYLAAGARGAAGTAAGLLLAYGALLASGPLNPEGNLPARVDRAIFGAHLWTPAFDPEGALSTLGAIATTLLGIPAGERLRSAGSTWRKATELLVAGLAGAILGLLTARLLPINKSLWTPSYVLLMAGLASAALAACVVLVDELSGVARRIASPFVWLGRNAIAAFALSSLATIVLIAVRIRGADGRSRSLWAAIHRQVFDRFGDPRLGSLLFALAYLTLWIALFGLLYRKKIFVKI